MARPRSTKASAPSLSPGQASYVIGRMISERRVTSVEVQRYLGEMHREISDLEQRLATLRSVAGSADAASQPPAPRRGRTAARPAKSSRKRRRRAAAAAVPAGGSPKAAPARRRRRSKITPEQVASRQLQGRYLGLIRQIPASKRSQYQKIAKERGREAAVREMAQTLGK